MRAILIDGLNKGEVIDLACNLFPDVVKTYPPRKPETTFEHVDGESLQPIIYYFKHRVSLKTAKYSIEVSK